jgi:LPPG:FO 2-phospho-L-lactate transferase
MKVTCLAGGVGAGKFLRGLLSFPNLDLTVVVNVGDDFELHGLYICPDIDSVCYWMADLADRQRGWGRINETYNVMDELAKLGGETWFTLGDKDLALHLFRTNLLSKGYSLSEVTELMVKKLGIKAKIYPATDDKLRTFVKLVDDTIVPFQHYFVKLSHSVEVKEILFSHEDAQPTEEILDVISLSDVIIICPSNPFLSIAPILEISSIKQRLLTKEKIIAISPIVKSKALKGPLDKMLEQLGYSVSAFGVACFYKGIVTDFIIDNEDSNLVNQIRSLEMNCWMLDTVMTDLSKAESLARQVLEIASVK